MLYKCDICSKTMENKSSGKSFDQNRVLTSPGYWMYLYTKAQTRITEDNLGSFLAMFSKDTSGYTVCDQCEEILKKDYELGKEYNIEKSIVSIPSGQVDTYAAGTVAGTVWQKLNGSWPSTLELGGGGATGTLKSTSNHDRGGIFNFIKKLFAPKDSVVTQIGEPLDDVCDKLMAEHLRKTDGVLIAIAMTVDVLLKEYQLSEDEAKSVVVRWGHRNKQ